MADKETPWAGWSFNQDSRVLKLVAHTQHWEKLEWVPQLTGGLEYEAAEGFWIRRPWTSAEECPATAVTNTASLTDEKANAEPDRKPEAKAPSEARQTFGLAQFFAPDAPRTFQRGNRPYSFTLREKKDAIGGTRKYRLSLSGRISGYPDGQPIRCWNEASDLRPKCLMAVELARVAFEEVESGKVLAEWLN